MPTTAADMASHSSVRWAARRRSYRPWCEDRDRDRDGQRQQHHAEDPAGNAVGDQYGEKDQRGRAGGQGQQAAAAAGLSGPPRRHRVTSPAMAPAAAATASRTPAALSAPATYP